MLRIEDPNDNDGRGWSRLSEDQLVGLLYIGLKVAKLQHRSGLSARNADKADDAAKAIATLLAERLRLHLVFGPARQRAGHSCGGGDGGGGGGASKSVVTPSAS